MPAATASAPPTTTPDHPGLALRALATHRPDSEAAMRTESEGLAARLTMTRWTQGHAPKAFAEETAATSRKRHELRAFADYLASGAKGPFVEPDLSDAIGSDVLRAFVGGFGFPSSVARFVRRIDDRIARMEELTANLASHDSINGQIRIRSLPLHEYVGRAVSQLARHHAIVPKLDALKAARAKVGPAIATSIAAAVASKGGADVVVTAMREAVLLGDVPGYFVDEASTNRLAIARRKLGELDVALGKLGITDPASVKKAPPGIQAASLWQQRLDTSKSIRDMADAEESRLLAFCGGVVQDATSGGLGSWEVIHKACLAVAGAFPPGFSTAWVEAIFAALDASDPGVLASTIDE